MIDIHQLVLDTYPTLKEKQDSIADKTCTCGCLGKNHKVELLFDYCTTITDVGTHKKKCLCRKFKEKS